MSMKEKLARALCLSQFSDESIHGESRCCQVGGVAGCCSDSFMPNIRSVLLALREPDERMVGAAGKIVSHYEHDGCDEWNVYFDADQVRALWPALIDHILSDTQPKGEE